MKRTRNHNSDSNVEGDGHDTCKRVRTRYVDTALVKMEGDQRAEESKALPPIDGMHGNPTGSGNVEVKAEMNEDSSSNQIDRKEYFRQMFNTRRKSSVRAKEKRVRENRRLRKCLIPKNAMMSLNELKGVHISEFLVTNNGQGGFSASLTVNQRTFVGSGPSKVCAKNDACEKALREYVLIRLQKYPRNVAATKPSSSLKEETNEGNEIDINPKVESNVADSKNLPNAVGVDSNNGQIDKTEGEDDEEEVPILNLASFALYKLFSQWEMEGYLVPEMHPNQKSLISEADGWPLKKKQKIRQSLPANWNTMHPTSLLCMMRPGVSYEDATVPVNNSVQSISVTVDGCMFIGNGLSKKVARREAAASACNSLFGTNFQLNNY